MWTEDDIRDIRAMQLLFEAYEHLQTASQLSEVVDRSPLLATTREYLRESIKELSFEMGHHPDQVFALMEAYPPSPELLYELGFQPLE